MMILRSAGPSPFGRMVEIAAAMLGLEHDFEIVMTDTVDPDDTIRRQNPLGKIPALIVDGAVYYDSRVILDYLDHRAGAGTLIPQGETRFRVLTELALAAGLIDAAILEVYETRFRDAARHEPKWLAHQRGKVSRALAAFERRQPGRSAQRRRHRARLRARLPRPALRRHLARGPPAPRRLARGVRGRGAGLRGDPLQGLSIDRTPLNSGRRPAPTPARTGRTCS